MMHPTQAEPLLREGVPEVMGAAEIDRVQQRVSGGAFPVALGLVVDG
jgi:hypothetical protein